MRPQEKLGNLEWILKKSNNCFDFIYIYIWKKKELRTKLALEAENIQACNIDREFCMLSICFPSAIQVVDSSTYIGHSLSKGSLALRAASAFTIL